MALRPASVKLILYLTGTWLLYYITRHCTELQVIRNQRKPWSGVIQLAPFFAFSPLQYQVLIMKQLRDVEKMLCP